jgi:23S rRNA (uracil1939-C5)-methyltransferase
MASTGRPVQLRIERVVAGGDALAHGPDGRVVFVPGALPGELVSAQLVSSKRDFARAALLDVVEPSASRVGPPCRELARGCGGCDWQHIDPAAQLALKVEIVRDALRRTAKLPDAPVRAGRSVPAWAYRTSMRLALDTDGHVALRAARSNDAVPVEECLVAHPALAELLQSLRIAGADEVSLRVGVASGLRSAWWVPDDAVASGVGPDVGTGPGAWITERIAGRDLRVSAASFFQSGPHAAELLVDVVREVAGDDLDAASSVVDAYGGVGLFASCAVPAGARTVLVEGSPWACADARANLADRSAEVVESAMEEWTPTTADVVVADPSRRGLGAAAVDRLAATNAATIVLVSCDPVALARDATLLAPRYELASATVVDLFPQTHHVEVVSRFERRASQS